MCVGDQYIACDKYQHVVATYFESYAQCQEERIFWYQGFEHS
jgi:hypothetical protein